MRLWSLHPRYLDRQGLTGGWREALLAQAVLAGRTKGYRSHPQLVRFRAHPDPAAAIGAFLQVTAEEATERGYNFDVTRIDRPGHPASGLAHDAGRDLPVDGTFSGVPRLPVAQIPVTEGQVAYEWKHLLAKIGQRTPERLEGLVGISVPQVHPSFEVVPGDIESWERLG
ncbi:pyrimidine dimer DNA glycosylase /DNA-(apurinic or apyrimidinic site) lyase [Citricoccus zhacaiensis]|uniref:Pyrimidine dimer DNA glycosylase /DNA-(Apurinic or apyrimidinic site) lyase n=1 Tax=Citricoccus zhacaiensis TaxID=489142 RepID=A0ABQ2M5Q2_9MICC|nr:pyrimidine dimer DNA glycosylase/endonuclease V [Citricoccus zhacaiensis]GGO47182.1 pyrimidine dimer DNA glycosylase /DNA-(apurinic or apyrimidinic site) lyase [Citricoccus zhacaiensis]